MIILLCVPVHAEKPVSTETIENIKVQFPFYLYRTYGDSKNFHYYLSGLVGDHYDVRISGQHKKNPYVGTSCIRIVVDYSDPDKIYDGWVGMYWLYPANNWGQVNVPTYDLTGAKRLVFYARGEKGGERLVCKIGGMPQDSGSSESLEVKLTKEWKRYVIRLNKVNLSRIINGFCCIVNKKDNKPEEIVFYLDSIYYDDKEDAGLK